MAHSNRKVSEILKRLTLGSSVAENDELLFSSRVETSAFTDLIADRVDLIPGTKGSGKSALFRIFIELLPDHLLEQHKVVVAHGVHAPGDPVFHAFLDQFSTLSEDEFVSFWCIYLVSLAHHQFIADPRFQSRLSVAKDEVQRFRAGCQKAGIPEIKPKKSLMDVLEWSLAVLKKIHPKLTYKLPSEGGEIELDLFGGVKTASPDSNQATPTAGHSLPTYASEIKDNLDATLEKASLSLWLMVDRLDEVFPRRSDTERRALRGLLRAMRFFSSKNIRVKIFLRDDMLDHVVDSPEGFTALTHVTVRQADRLRWTQEQLLTLIGKRLFACQPLARYLRVDPARVEASASYREDCFYKVFPPRVFRGQKQAKTLVWIYNRCADGRGVVTPRDVLDLLIRAKQRQEDICAADADGTTEYLIDSPALKYGLEELSKRKRKTYLEAEFPHLWAEMAKFIGGKTEYTAKSISALLGAGWQAIADDLVAVGFLSRAKQKANGDVYTIPFIYRHSLDVTQGKA